MTNKEKNDDAFIARVNKKLDQEEKTKKENSKVKNFFTHTIAKLFYLVAAIVFIVWATLFVRQAIEDYNQHYIDKGIQIEKDRQANFEKEMAARLKTTQQ